MPTGVIVMVLTVLMFPYVLILWNKFKVRGKMLCFFLRDDKSLLPKLCELRDSWVIFGNRAYDIYPDLVRTSRFPMGWPTFLQEIVVAGLYDEENAIPLDWITMQPRVDRSMEVKAALDQNWIRKLVEETAREGQGGGGINWRKVLPFIIIGVGIVGLILMFVLRR